jgi:hypothetical protein
MKSGAYNTEETKFIPWRLVYIVLGRLTVYIALGRIISSYEIGAYSTRETKFIP